MFKIIECPRDAMQGIHDFIPTEQKISYLNALISVKFPIMDCGSFVSPKAIPQLADTKEVLNEIDKSEHTKLSVIVANIRGSERAIEHPRVSILGFPFSISETFQQYNTNKSRIQAFEQIKQIQQLCNEANKELIVYFSMAFGNPYNETWSTNLVIEWTKRFADIGIKTINLSDTVGVADTKDIEVLFKQSIQQFPEIEIGAHFHTEYYDWSKKVKTAFDNGCRRFDGAIKGFGGCPMAKSDLVGNMPTEKLISFMQEQKIEHNLDLLAFESSYNRAMQLFG